MKFLMLLTCLLAVKAHGFTDDVYIDGVPHQREVVYDISLMSWVYSLAVDYEYDYLYIVERYDSVRTVQVIVDLNTKEHKYFFGKENHASSISVDLDTHDVYIGTRDGIYKYKPSSGGVHLVGAAGVTVWDMYFNGVLYYIDYWTNKISTLINGYSDELVNVKHYVHRLVIDNEDVMFFSNNSRLYSQQMYSDHTTLYYNKSYVNNLAVDRNGRVYFTTDDGIYEIIKQNASYRKVVTMETPVVLTFDKNNNMIYYDRNKVYRLRPKAEVIITNNSCSDSHDQNIDVTNTTNTMNIVKQLETKLDIMDQKMDKLVNYQVEMQKNMSHKNDKLETDLVKILESVTNIYKLITDKAESNQELENMDSQDKTSDEPGVTSQVFEQADYSASSPRADDSSLH